MAPSIAGPLLPSQPLPSSKRPACKYTAQNSSNRPLDWETVVKIAPLLRGMAVQQLVQNWHRYKDLDSYEALWGDELEYFLASLEQGAAKPLLEQARVLNTLQSSETALCFQPEYAKCCVESNPLAPYGSSLANLLEVEPNMRERRSQIKRALRKGETVLTLTSFPNFGMQSGPAEHTISESAPAYALSRRNLLVRRQREWKVSVPIFPDEITPLSSDTSTASLPSPDHVILNDFNFGATQCCMQITMQAKNIGEARQIYDQLISLSPIMLALTAATPIYKRRLVNTDVRWNVLKSLFDDRNPQELARDQLPQSRWCSNSTYLNSETGARSMAAENDRSIDKSVLGPLLDAGMDATMANHFAQILRWDPVKLMTSDIEDLGPDATNLFELFNNSCYQGVRFKPPPGGSNPHSIGWRVEFRSMEVQLTDFENAAFAVFIYLVSRVIVEYNLNLRIPLDDVEENFDTAHKVNAVVEEKFWFRTSEWCTSGREDVCTPDGARNADAVGDPVHGLLSIDRIINGPPQHAISAPTKVTYQFPGLIPLIKLYLARYNAPPDTERQLLHYLDFVSARASGATPTAATWMRAFVRSHPDYFGDSVVSERTVFDLLSEIDRLAV